MCADVWANQFKHPVYYPAGTLPYQVTTADFNNDGNLDLAITDSDTVAVLLGNGDGTFQKPRIFSAPSAIAITSGDFDEDGNADLAVTQTGGTGAGEVTIFLGDGKGGFRRGGTKPIGVGGSSVAAADFNGDGHLDVVVADKGFDKPGNVMVFFGTGKGTLHTGTRYKISGGPFGVAAGDLNGDHLPDLAVALDTAGSVAVLLNDGTGKFGKPTTYYAGNGEVVDAKIADLNHDGMNDLAAVNASKNEIAVLLNKGNGTFKPAQYYTTGSSRGSGTNALVIADFNLDGNLDIAAVNLFGDSALLYGRGNGTFKPAVPINAGVGSNNAFSIAAGDFNNDGAPDLAIPIEITNKPKGKVAILLNTQ